MQLRAFQPYHQILCVLKHVKGVKDRSNTLKSCNAMYVEDVEDGKRTYTYIFAHNFLNQFGKSFGKRTLIAFQPYHQVLCILNHVEDVKDYIMQHYMESTHYIDAHVEDVKSVKYYE